jgi:predicted transcriptional regulator
MTDMIELDSDDDAVLAMASDIVAAYASNNQIAAADLPALLRSVHATLNDLGGGAAAPAAEEEEAAETPPAPAVPIDASVKTDAIVCLDCGKSFKTLKRHLSTEHGMSPADYRARWQLSKDYPLVAPSYSARRAETAKRIGLGRKPAK